jgi:hypothetical protein
MQNGVQRLIFKDTRTDTIKYKLRLFLEVPDLERNWDLNIISARKELAEVLNSCGK